MKLKNLFLFFITALILPASVFAASNPLRPNPFDLVPEEQNKTFDQSKDSMTVGVAEGSILSSFSSFITPFLSGSGNVSPGGDGGGPAPNPLGQWLQWPSETKSPGYYTSCYGKRCWINKDGSKHLGNHTGIDLSYGDGAGIYAAAAGKVIFADFNSIFGYCVIIDHQNGWFTIYGHMGPNLQVNSGQNVDTDTVLGYQDGSGESTGTHLHFGVSQGGSITDFFMASGLTIDPCSALANCGCDPQAYNGLDKCP